jgi:hypothetical protein
VSDVAIYGDLLNEIAAPCGLAMTKRRATLAMTMRHALWARNDTVILFNCFEF